LCRIIDKITRRDKPIRIIGDKDNQRPDKWSCTVFKKKGKVCPREGHEDPQGE